MASGSLACDSASQCDGSCSRSLFSPAHSGLRVAHRSGDPPGSLLLVGNQMILGDQAQYVLPAMQNIHSVLLSAGLADQIKVSTSIGTKHDVLEKYSPPSSSRLSSGASTCLRPIVQFLASNGAPLLVNLYTYRHYISNPNHIRPDLPLFTSLGTVILDGQYNYQNLFDTIMDALYVSLENLVMELVEV